MKINPPINLHVWPKWPNLESRNNILQKRIWEALSDIHWRIVQCRDSPAKLSPRGNVWCVQLRSRHNSCKGDPLYPQTLILELSWLPAIVTGSHLHLPVIVHGSSPTRAHCWKYGCYLSLSHLALNTIQSSWPNHYKLLRQYYFFSTKFQDFLWVLYPYHIGWAFCQLYTFVTWTFLILWAF